MTTHTLTALTIRSFRGEDDLPRMAELARVCNRADDVEHTPTLEELRHWTKHLVNANPNDDILVAERDGQVVGYGWTHWRQEHSGEYLYMLGGFVHPDWRRQGIGRALLERAEARLRAVRAAHPAEARGFFQTYTPLSRAGKLTLFERAGYYVARRNYEMLRPDLDNLPEAPLPAGLELRPAPAADRRALRVVLDAVEEAFIDHWGTVPPTEEDFEQMMAAPTFDPSLWQVAHDSATGEVAGAAINIIPADRPSLGWVDSLAVRRPYRKRGLGRALLVGSLRLFRQRGLAQSGLGVDAENITGALRLYEAVGFRVHKEGVILRKAL